MTPARATTDPIARIRRFNRFYTRRLRLLAQAHLGSPLTLSEVRILYEIAHRHAPTATEIGDALQLDPGYLSRTLRALRASRLITARTGTTDRRARMLGLTARGRALVRQLDREASAQVREVVADLNASAIERVVTAMAEIEMLLDDHAAPGTTAAVELRAPEPGDLGWIVQRHGECYHQEYGWSDRFEHLVVKIVDDFAARAASPRDRCWVAWVDGRRAGSIFLMRDTDDVARLRLLLVEPWARGHGVGGRLISACLEAAREAGYRRMTLWTNSVLDPARRLYQRAGFALVHSKKHRMFGVPLIGQTWERDLS